MASIKKQFEELEIAYNKLDSGEAINIGDIITSAENLSCLIDNMGIFSKNEELEDISTESLQFLNINYFIGKLHMSISDLRVRSSHLKSAIVYFERYISICSKYGIIHDDDLDKLEKYANSNNENIPKSSQLTAEQKRTIKIESFKKKSEINKKMEVLKHIIKKSNNQKPKITVSVLNKLENETEESGPIHSTDDAHDDDNDDDFFDYETEIRELRILQLKARIYEAFEDIPALHQEISMLAHMDNLSAASKTSSMVSPELAQRQIDTYGRVLPVDETRLDHMRTQKSTFEVTHINKAIDGSLVMRREEVHSKVFVPSMSEPTMTIEEFGELELERMKAAEAEAAKKSVNTAPIPKKYNELEAAGEEDNADLVEKSVYLDREWDAWREDNPKGSGNKMNKRF